MTSTPALLVGDIGGTRARLSLLSSTGRTLRHEVKDSKAFASPKELIASFLGPRHLRLRAAVLGIAGPVVNGRCVATNLPWIVDARRLSKELGIPRVTLLNDLVALSLGALGVPRSKLHPLGDAGTPKKKGANVVVIAAGTGLGEALLVWDASRERFVPTGTEGGHSDFAPRNELEVDLFRFFRDSMGLGRVSWERALSGRGIGNLYDFFRKAKGVPESDRNKHSLDTAADRNAEITRLGTDGESEAASMALSLFASIYGAEAGNLALKALATGGVYVCGNIAVRTLAVLERGDFYRAFVDKGRFAPLMARIPVAVVLDTDVGLSGAKRVALGKA